MENAVVFLALLIIFGPLVGLIIWVCFCLIVGMMAD